MQATNWSITKNSTMAQNYEQGYTTTPYPNTTAPSNIPQQAGFWHPNTFAYNFDWDARQQQYKNNGLWQPRTYYQPTPVPNQAPIQSPIGATFPAAKPLEIALPKRPHTEESSTLRALLTNPAKKLKYASEYTTNSTTITTTIEKKSDVVIRSNEVLPPIYLDDFLEAMNSSTIIQQKDTDFFDPEDEILTPPPSTDTFSTLPAAATTVPATVYNGSLGMPGVVSMTERPPQPPTVSDMTTPPVSPGEDDQKQQQHGNFTAEESNQSKISDESLAVDGKRSKRTRQTYTRYQTTKLEGEFQLVRYVTRRRRIELSSTLGLTERQIKIWFQNRRMKAKKDQTAPEYNGASYGAANTTISPPAQPTEVPFAPNTVTHTAYTADYVQSGAVQNYATTSYGNGFHAPAPNYHQQLASYHQLQQQQPNYGAFAQYAPSAQSYPHNHGAQPFAAQQTPAGQNPTYYGF